MKVMLKKKDQKNLNFSFYRVTNKVYNINAISTLSYEFMFVTMIEWLHRCCWRMLVTKCVSGKFEMLVNDSGCWCLNYYIEKITNIMILPPASEISHPHEVTKRQCHQHNCHPSIGQNIFWIDHCNMYSIHVYYIKLTVRNPHPSETKHV